MAKWKGLETRMHNIFVRDIPGLPDPIRLALVAWLPIISLVLSPLAFLEAWGLWSWAQVERRDTLYGVCNTHSVSGCGNTVAAEQLHTALLIGVGLACLQGLLYLLSYTGLRNRRRWGWKCLYYGALLNIAFLAVGMFTGYDSIWMLRFWTALSAIIVGFYLLFQVRDTYARKRATTEQTGARS